LNPTADIPAHVAIVMDGNGRWAAKKNRPRTFGHQAGLKSLRKIVEHAARIGISELTVFAFSSENWNRPEKEVSRLMDLFMRALDREAKELHENGIRIRFIGDLTAFTPELQVKIGNAVAHTSSNRQMTLNVAANYGGRWDIVNAVRKTAEAVADGRLTLAQIDEDYFSGRTRTCLSAPAAKCESAIFCSGSQPTPNSFSHPFFGRISRRTCWTRRSPRIARGSADSAAPASRSVTGRPEGPERCSGHEYSRLWSLFPRLSPSSSCRRHGCSGC
jgi:undecaprenyl diphosphate synthase